MKLFRFQLVLVIKCLDNVRLDKVKGIKYIFVCVFFPISKAAPGRSVCSVAKRHAPPSSGLHGLYVTSTLGVLQLLPPSPPPWPPSPLQLWGLRLVQGRVTVR